MQIPKERTAENSVDPLFPSRWSPVAFKQTPVTDKTLNTIFEAARWSPSSFNEQPWLFVYANSEDDLKRFRPLLVDANRTWADTAPVLIFVFAKKNFSRNNTPNRCAQFDTGAAWMSLALQAHKLGFITHGMAGIHAEKVYAELKVDQEQYEAICAVALGEHGDTASLPANLQPREIPSTRKPLSEIARKA